MKKIINEKKYNSTHQLRYNRTIDFLSKWVNKSDRILDLGPTNPLSQLISEKGYKIQNTAVGEDLDYNYEVVKTTEYDVLSAFEILEHLVSPFPLLHEAKATKLIASIPLKLWFSDAYWNDDNPYARHYHEFEPKQFDMLLDKAGWEIKQSEKWISPSNKIGIRPFLRKITPRYYIVYCERK